MRVPSNSRAHKALEMQKLPTELLGFVFEELAASCRRGLEERETFDEARAAAPFVLASVCHRWREIVLHTPQAWIYLGVGSRFYRAVPMAVFKNYVDHILACSRRALLDICVMGLPTDWRKDFEWLMVKVCAQFGRLARLSLGVDDWNTTYPHIWSVVPRGVAASLEKFQVDQLGDEDQRIFAFPNSALLSHVLLSRIFLPRFPLPPMKSPTFLEIIDTCLISAEFLLFFYSCPQLEKLVMCNITSEEVHPPARYPLHALPQLRFLSLNDCSDLIASFSNFSFPGLKLLHISEYPDDPNPCDGTEFLLIAILRGCSVLEHLVCTWDTFREFDEFVNVLKTLPSLRTLRLTTRFDSEYWQEDHFDSPPPDADAPPDADDGMPAGLYRRFLEKLSYPARAGAGAPKTWILPQLTALHLSYDFTGAARGAPHEAVNRAIADVVRARAKFPDPRLRSAAALREVSCPQLAGSRGCVRAIAGLLGSDEASVTSAW